jgi:hypothetical protein
MATWVVPQELQQATPRRTRPKASFIILGIIVAAMMVLPLGIVGHVFISVRDLQAFKATGTPIEGTVDNLTSRYISGRHAHTNYYVSYSFHAKRQDFDGVKNILARRTALISATDYQTLRINQKIPIIYDPTQLDKSVLAFERTPETLNDPADALGRSSYITSGFLFVVYGLLFGSVWPVFFKERSLLRWGKIAHASVITKEEKRGRGGAYINLTYSFRDDMGATVQAINKRIPAAQIGGKEEMLTVLYDPNDSSKSAIYPLKYIVCRS